jgi:O-Antigen ligase
LVLALALPFLFLHEHYQPTVSIGSIDVDLSDVAVLAVVVAACSGVAALRRARGALSALAVLGAVIVAATFWGAALHGGYPFGTHVVTAAKWIEYMLLAPAVAVIGRRRGALVPAACSLVAWSIVATLVGALQFVGALGDLDGTPAGRRKPSLLGYHDFSGLSAAAVALAFVILARGARSGRERRVAQAAGAAGTIGLVLGGAFDALLGLVLAALAVVLVARLRDRRKLAIVGATLLAALAGTIGIRSHAVADGLKFLGLKQGTGGAAVHVQSYRQRVLLAYIGGRIFLDHPLGGVGFEGSSDQFAYGPYVAAARRRFTQPPEAFPSPAHPWGVQNAYVQALADMGVIGLLAFLGAVAVPLLVALRHGAGDERVAGIAVALVAVGVWNGIGLVAGIPLDALTWLAVGTALASTVATHDSLTGAG